MPGGAAARTLNVQVYSGPSGIALPSSGGPWTMMLTVVAVGVVLITVTESTLVRAGLIAQLAGLRFSVFG